MSAGFVTLFGSVLHQDTEIMFMVGLTCLGTIMGDEKKPHFLQGTYTENGVVYTLDLNTNNPVNPTAYNIGFSARNEKPSITVGEVELLAANWTGSNNLHSQVVSIDGVTENSRIDLTPSVEQLAVFYDKDLAFVTENEDGIVTVYAIGQRPENDYTIQVTITEVRV